MENNNSLTERVNLLKENEKIQQKRKEIQETLNTIVDKITLKETLDLLSLVCHVKAEKEKDQELSKKWILDAMRIENIYNKMNN